MVDTERKMDVILNTVILFGICVAAVTGQTCYLSYYHCSGYDWCCPDGYVCTGSSTCLSIGAIVGVCIGALFGLAFLIFLVSFCCKSNKRMVGTVITQPGGTTTAVIGQQQHGQQYGQQPGFSQPASDNASYPPPYKQ